MTISKLALTEKIHQATGLLETIETQHGPAAFACSFGLEDMVLLDLIAKKAPNIEIFTLDTGRLPDETHALLDRVRDSYTVPVRVYFPDARLVEEWVEQNGPNGFYRSIAQRKQCCHIRKVLPLGRALEGKRAWITGLRREQSPARQSLGIQEWDDANGLHKFNPLLEWTLEDVWSYVKENRVPYNALHDRGYPSIGCAPCTRAVEPGQDLRAGRWWWEESGAKECGLHRPGDTNVGGPSDGPVKEAGAASVPSVVRTVGPTLTNKDVGEPSDRPVKEAGAAGVPSVGRTVGPTLKNGAGA